MRLSEYMESKYRKTDKPYPGMDKRKSKAESLHLKEKKELWEEEPEEDNIKRQTAVFFDGVIYGQTPKDLLKDPSNKPQLKALYPVYHLHCKVKHLNSNPCTFISQERIGREYFGWTQQTVSYWTIKIEDAGWCTIIRQGQGHSNIIVLHDRKGKRISAQEKRNFIKLLTPA